jgi:hypothetical protein
MYTHSHNHLSSTLYTGAAFTEVENKLDENRGGPDANGRLAKDRLTLSDVEKMIDHALEEDDYDNDGMISWAEYLESQKKHKQM